MQLTNRRLSRLEGFGVVCLGAEKVPRLADAAAAVGEVERRSVATGDT